MIGLQKEIKELRKGSTVDEDGLRDEDDKVCYIQCTTVGMGHCLGVASWQLIHVYSHLFNPL